jgi:hypothetical protein
MEIKKMEKKLTSFRIDPESWARIRANAKKARLTTGEYIEMLNDFAETGGLDHGPFEKILSRKIQKARKKHFLELANVQLDQMTGIPEDEKIELIETLKKGIK